MSETKTGDMAFSVAAARVRGIYCQSADWFEMSVAFRPFFQMIAEGFSISCRL